MKSNCNIIRDILPLYIEDMASVDTVSFVEEHLAICEECRAELEQMKNPKELENKSENIEAKHAIKTIKKKWSWKIGVLVLYYIPVIVALTFYGTLALVAGLGVIQTSAWFFVGFLVLAAILMTKNKWWGCIGGIVVGITLIYMSTQYTGQVIDIERPLGIIFCAYYIICGFLTYKQTK